MQAPDEIRARLRGPVNSLPTIFTPDGAVDYDGIRSAIDYTIANGGNVIMLTWGDSLISLLTDDEVAAVHRTVIEHVGGRAPDHCLRQHVGTEQGPGVRPLRPRTGV